jgi:hypothetical protein
MRKSFVKPVLVFAIVLMLFSFQRLFNSPVKGSVNPSDAALRAWVFSQTDTVNAPVNQGYFTIEGVKPGNYILMLEGRPPYRNTVKKGIQVSEGQPTDVGVIEMEK